MEKLSPGVLKARLEDRRAEVFRLKKSGKTNKQIAEELGVTTSTVGADVKIVLKKLQQEQVEDANLWRVMELERLDDIMTVLDVAVKKGDLAAIDRYLRVSQARRELLGLDAPENSHLAIDLKNLSDDELKKIAGQG
jgi:DNA-binding NarL/FixJ family response regulator